MSEGSIKHSCVRCAAFAFAALQANGTVIAWGDATYGGNIRRAVREQVSSVVAIFANVNAFSALRGDGNVVSWGGSYGGNSEDVKAQLCSVETIYSNDQAFAALRTSATVVTWGEGESGGNSQSVASELVQLNLYLHFL